MPWLTTHEDEKIKWWDTTSANSEILVQLNNCGIKEVYKGRQHTGSIKPNSCARCSLSRSKTLLTDAGLPTANNIRSPERADNICSKWSCSFLSKLDTSAGIPSRAPGNVHYTMSREITFGSKHNTNMISKMYLCYHHLRPLRKANPLLQIWWLHCKCRPF